MQRGLIRVLLCLGMIAAGGWLAGCYVGSTTRPDQLRSDVLTEAEAEQLISSKLAPYGIKFISNMRLKRVGVDVLVDGYDRDMQIGYIYRSHEGGDFKGESGQREDGISNSDIEAIKGIQANSREYFLIIDENSRAEVEKATDDFVHNLFAWEVLKKKGPDNKKKLFPNKAKQGDETIPWEATGDPKRKRKEMEAKEAAKSAREANPKVTEPQKGGFEIGGDKNKEKTPSVTPPSAKQGQPGDDKKDAMKVPDKSTPAKEPVDEKKKAPASDDWGPAEDENF
jgi:hypothetical protein